MNVLEFPTDGALLAADVDSLYPSIDITRGLDAINQALLEWGATPNDREFTIFLLRDGCCLTTSLNSTTSYTYKSEVQQWEPLVRLFSHAYLWAC